MRKESQPSQEEMQFSIMMKGLADEGESLFAYSKKSQFSAASGMKKNIHQCIYLF